MLLTRDLYLIPVGVDMVVRLGACLADLESFLPFRKGGVGGDLMGERWSEGSSSSSFLQGESSPLRGCASVLPLDML